MGGMIVQEMAIRHPAKVKSLCSIMSNTGDRKNGGFAFSLIRKAGRMEPPTRDTAAARSVEMFALIGGSHRPDAAEALARAEEGVDRSFRPQGTARQTAAIAGSRDRTAGLGSVTAPTLVIHGLMDPLVKPSGGEMSPSERTEPRSGSSMPPSSRIRVLLPTPLRPTMPTCVREGSSRLKSRST